MGLHFAQTALAFLAGGAAILIVAGLVRESLPGDGRQLHLFPDADDGRGKAVAEAETEANATEPGRFNHSRGDKRRGDKMGRSRNRQEPRSPKRRSKQRGGKKRQRQQAQTQESGPIPAAEAEQSQAPL